MYLQILAVLCHRISYSAPVVWFLPDSKVKRAGDKESLETFLFLASFHTEDKIKLIY